MNIIEHPDGSVVLSFPYDEKTVRLVRVLGGSFNPQTKTWVVREPFCVDLLKRCKSTGTSPADAVTSIVDRSSLAYEVRKNIELPPGVTLKSAQWSAVDWIARREASLIADPMGAGKMVIAAVAANHIRAKRVLVVCIASVKAEWRRRWRQFNAMAAAGETSVGIASGSFWPNTDVVIVNFDILERFRTKFQWNPSTGRNEAVRNGLIDMTDWDMVIIDETQRAKGLSAKRTRAIIGSSKAGHMVYAPLPGRVRVGLSGTPALNRPSELFPILHWLWPRSFPSFYDFAYRYCDAKSRPVYPGARRKALDTTGCSNPEELNARIRLLGMLARPKSLTHDGVPDKYRKIITVPAPNEELLRKESEIVGSIEQAEQSAYVDAVVEAVFANEQGWRSAMRELKRKSNELESATRPIEQSIVMESLPRFVELTKERLQEPETRKIVIMTWHRAVAYAASEAIPGSVVFTGDTRAEERDYIIRKFQEDPGCRVIVGTIGALGTGTTLTAANVMQFYELCWVPGELAQAEDRIHRHTQEHEVTIEYLCVLGSVSARKAERLIDKMDVLDRCTGQLRTRLLELPVSSVPAVDEPAFIGAIPELDASPEPPKTARDVLLSISRGNCEIKPAPVDQVIAGRLAGVGSWNQIQKGIAVAILRRYAKDWLTKEAEQC